MTLTKSAPPSKPVKTPRVKTMRQTFAVTEVKKSPRKAPLMKEDVGIRNLSIFTFVRRGLWDQTVSVRKGLPSNYIAEMSKALAMPRANFLDSLQLPRSTIEARIKNNTPLTPSEGDAVLRAAKALAKAVDVFEDHAAAAGWIKREIRSLGGVTPVSLMDTDSGFALVMNTLGRIEHGVVA
jgi:putative toxin-antitoxin system antitoxin component (TIGR02293 family)